MTVIILLRINIFSKLGRQKQPWKKLKSYIRKLWIKCSKRLGKLKSVKMIIRILHSYILWFLRNILTWHIPSKKLLSLKTWTSNDIWVWFTVCPRKFSILIKWKKFSCSKTHLILYPMTLISKTLMLYI